MRSRVLKAALVLSVIAVGISSVLLETLRADAQGVSQQVIANYLERTGVSWKRNDKDPNEFIVTKTTGFQKADRVEIYVYNDAKKDLVALRAYPKASGKYLSLSGAGDRTGLMKVMLERNSTAFGAYFVDKAGDIGFRYVFTTESGLGYEAFKTVVNQLFRIADEGVVGLYNSHR